MNTSKRNECIDALKCIFAFLIVCLHFPIFEPHAELSISNLLPTVWYVMLRMAVPFFYCVTGFYFTSIVRNERFRKYIIRIILLALGGSILYGLRYMWLYDAGGSEMNFGKIDIIFFAVFNVMPFGAHLWFLFALIYGLGLMYVIQCYNLWRLAFPASVILYLTGIAIQRFTSLPFPYFRNFIFVGFPLLVFGRQLYYWCSKSNRNFKPYTYIIALTACFALSIVEVNTSSALKEFYLFPTIGSLVLLAIASNIDSRSMPIRALASIGRKHSGYIYVLHFGIGLWLADLIEITFPGFLQSLIFGLSLACSMVYVKVKNMFKCR